MSGPDPVAFYNDWFFTTNQTDFNCPNSLPCPPPSKACARDPTNGARYCCDGQPDAKSKVGRVCWRGPTTCRADGSTVDCSNSKRTWCCLSELERCSQTPGQEAAICWSTRHDPLYNVSYDDLDRLHGSLSSRQTQATVLSFDLVSLISATATAPFATASSAPSSTQSGSSSTSSPASSSSGSTATPTDGSSSSSSPAQGTQNSSAGGGGVSGGAIAGIVVGAVVAAALVAIAVFFLLKRRKNKGGGAATPAELGGGPLPAGGPHEKGPHHYPGGQEAVPAAAVEADNYYSKNAGSPPPPGYQYPQQQPQQQQYRELIGEGHHAMRSELPVEEPQELPGSYAGHHPGSGGSGAPYSPISSTTAGYQPSPYSETSTPMR
ncbi:hypothetical protein GGTG_11895 [Gaeumannomyces tritici R3-111a-1]|uniref:Mid2 domain-containing protein n=1 Tax=Gaeumannomyces tritici (strain R3-111a-1) TaxID=644352 RepID=J3PEG4_GAET3|nr:hypothetical protein GGTG_11895 [Gaeumannomyces tritici R3-111a-1]EJT70872.1 hypothetical protein GGTG_11895 [Gaeumannomyces tritici R3-111a-1]